MRSSLALLAVVAATMLASAASAQTITVGGYARSDYLYDTRQVLDVREGYLHLYPLDVARTRVGTDSVDANATDNAEFVAFQSRLFVAGSGVRALGADASAHVEGDFFGPTNAALSTFVLRRAYVKLAWANREALLGQDWSPAFTPEMAPGTVNFSTGAPFQPFARFPQARLTYKSGALRLNGTLSMQRDAFSEIGGAKLQQQAAIPAAHLHAHYATPTLFAGAGAGVKWIRPSLVSERIDAGYVMAYARATLPTFSVAAKGFYGEDNADHLMPGGFVALAPKATLPAPSSGAFASLRGLAGWLDVQTTPTAERPLHVGLFAGYYANQGTAEAVATAANGQPTLGSAASTFARSPMLASLWRVAPRVGFAQGKVRLLAEVEATGARYGRRTAAGAYLYDARLRPDTDGQDGVTNLRGIVSAIYSF